MTVNRTSSKLLVEELEEILEAAKQTRRTAKKSAAKAPAKKSAKKSAKKTSAPQKAEKASSAKPKPKAKPTAKKASAPAVKASAPAATTKAKTKGKSSKVGKKGGGDPFHFRAATGTHSPYNNKYTERRKTCRYKCKCHGVGDTIKCRCKDCHGIKNVKVSKSYKRNYNKKYKPFYKKASFSRAHLWSRGKAKGKPAAAK